MFSRLMMTRLLFVTLQVHMVGGIGNNLTMTMFSDAQCPCSAQFVSDVKHILDNPMFAQVDFEQYFEPKCMDAVDNCGTDPASSGKYFECIHGDEECLGHRYFLCAQHLSRQDNRSSMSPPSYRSSSKWLEFQSCSYGQCQECDVFTELLCLTPCTTYTTFTQPDKNHIMEQCAEKVGIDWDTLENCANGNEAHQLQIASASVCRERKAPYGLKGLPVVTIGTKNAPSPTFVHTTQKIPLFCGPTPLEWLRTLCGEMEAPPQACENTTTLCAIIQNATRLPECR
eukprot:m.75368 g.75368  ORF g.75368 m.75368 type:complete len:284 (+) comp24779_c0_seq1:114-965(+)